MTSFMKGVLEDQTLQQTAGEALWSAVRYSIRPKAWGNGRTAGTVTAQPTDKSPLSPPSPSSSPLSPPASPAVSPVLSVASQSEAADERPFFLLPPAAATPSILISPTQPSTSFPGTDSDGITASPVIVQSASPSAAPPALPLPTPSGRDEMRDDGRIGRNVPAFAVASVDEDDLTPMFTITVHNNPH